MTDKRITGEGGMKGWVTRRRRLAERLAYLHCHSCGKRVSTGYVPVPTDTPDKGLIVRAWIECPECIEKKSKPTPTPVCECSGYENVKGPYPSGVCRDCGRWFPPKRAEVV